MKVLREANRQSDQLQAYKQSDLNEPPLHSLKPLAQEILIESDPFLLNTSFGSIGGLHACGKCIILRIRRLEALDGIGDFLT